MCLLMSLRLLCVGCTITTSLGVCLGVETKGSGKYLFHDYFIFVVMIIDCPLW